MDMRQPFVFFCFIAFVSLLCDKSNGSSIVETGCESLVFPSPSPNCFLKDLEILPSIHISESGIIKLSSATLCQEKCQSFDDCAYWTFREDKSSTTKTCHLKPYPSLSSSPRMIIRKYSADSKFIYTSGPKNCGQSCQELKSELTVGCEGSSPSVCESFGDSSFDASCGTDNHSSCNYFNYKCCKDCSREGSECCTKRVHGWRLTGGTDIKTEWNGILSVSHCLALCISTSGCTHWNFISSSTSNYMGGACYLKTYNPVNNPLYEQVPDYVDSVIGSVDCSRDYGIKDPTPSTTSSPPDFTEAPIEGTCFFAKTDIFGSQLFAQWGMADAQSCQKLCQEWPQCKAFVYDSYDTGCHLKYSLSGLGPAADESQNFVMGPRDCPNETPAPSVPGCLNSDTDIEGANIIETAVLHAAACGAQCMWYGECEGWVYLNSRCYIKANSSPTVVRSGVASGGRGCEWPGYNSRYSKLPSKPKLAQSHQQRLATESTVETGSSVSGSSASEVSASDLFPSSYEMKGCVHHDSEYMSSELKVVSPVDTLEECVAICQSVQKCEGLSFSPIETLCKIKSEAAAFIEKSGYFSMSRNCRCTGNVCSISTVTTVTEIPLMNNSTTERTRIETTTTTQLATSSTTAPAPGENGGAVTHAVLGTPQDWVTSGRTPDFTRPATWTRMAVLLLHGDRPENYCYVSDMVSHGKTCWEHKERLYPLNLRVQIISVPFETSFLGWENLEWSKRSLEMTQQDRHWELFNQNVGMLATGKPGADHGVFVQKLFGERYPDNWPTDLIHPEDFSNGTFYLRIENNGLPDPSFPFLFMICLTDTDYPLSEMCSNPVRVSNL